MSEPHKTILRKLDIYDLIGSGDDNIKMLHLMFYNIFTSIKVKCKSSGSLYLYANKIMFYYDFDFGKLSINQRVFPIEIFTDINLDHYERKTLICILFNRYMKANCRFGSMIMNDVYFNNLYNGN